MGIGGETMRNISKNQLQLYLVTDSSIVIGTSLEVAVEKAILGGVKIVQLREKQMSSKEFYELALRIKAITTKYHIPLIINDRLDIALAVDASGLHIGQNDLPASIARKLLGPTKILGVSAATLDEAIEAEKAEADYIGIGAFFPTNTKSDTRSVSLEQLNEIKKQINIPTVAIGGINQENARAVLENGADGIAVVSAILNQSDPKSASQKLAGLFEC